MRETIAIIPARSGSKRLPGKNIKFLGEYSLVGWAVETAKKCRLFDRIIISSDFIMQWPGCEIHRREGKDATDSAAFPPVIPRIVEGDALICLLQPTSPLRSATDILNGIRLWQENHSVISVTKINPYTLMLNGAVYIADISLLRDYGDFINPIYYTIPKIRSVDIDTEEDWEIAESLYTRGQLSGMIPDNMEREIN